MAKTEKGRAEDGWMISECRESSRVCAACSGVGHCVLHLKTICTGADPDKYTNLYWPCTR